MTRPRILVVEDDAIVALDIRVQLQAQGFDAVGHAGSGEQAVELAHALRPDLVLMDVRLGGAMDGIDAAARIRERSDIPVVFLTAHAEDETLERARQVEPAGYVIKPFTERELRAVLEMALFKAAAERRLRESTLHTQSILDNVADAVITIDRQGRIQSFNKAATQMFGYAPQDAIGRNVSMLMADHDRSEHDRYMQRFQGGNRNPLDGQPRDMEGRRKDGSLFPLNIAVSRTGQGGALTFIGLIRDVSRQRLAEEQIRRLAFYDHLTGLPNRRLLMDRLSRAMSSAGRHGQHGALMFLDLDNFKQLNDTLGHGTGDLLLKQVAARLQACMREADSVARLGGDEFVILLEALAHDAQEAGTQVEAVANKVLFALGQPYLLGDLRHVITPSIGIVVFQHGGEKVDDLLRMADAAMYQAKAAGRNTARFYDPAMQAAAEARALLEKDMRRGLAHDEFLLHYQVQVNGDGQPVGAEALVRWRHATRGMVPPGEFIPLAEQTGMILPLGQWVLETACAQLAAWAHDPGMAHWTMAVNVSASQFAHADFVGNVFRALEATGARADRLKLELTETMLAVDIEDIIFKMFAIKSRGVSFSLDDFGTGYSSLSYLKRLPLSQLKIDQSFVRDILSDPNDAAIARTILALGHTLGLEVIAEGVETTAQHAFLAQIGCDVFQGYLFGRPVPHLDVLGALAPPVVCH